MIAYGEANSEAVVECYIEILETLEKGDIETKCTKEALEDGWEALTE